MAPPKSPAPYPSGFGDNIRRLRVQKGLRIVDVAEQAGLTASSISQMERSLITPTIGTLKKIAAALECPLAEILKTEDDPHADVLREREEPPPVVRPVREPQIVSKEHRKVISPYKGVTYELLTPDFSGPFEFSYNLYKPGAGKGSEKRGHPGVETSVVLSGELLVRYGEAEKEYRLGAGDSITFDSTEPHSVENPGDVDCVCLWVNNPPWF